jgi:hypothetical protein
MDFSGFDSSDFDFFRKKGVVSKSEYDEKKEAVKRHFREFCYQIQKNYHVDTGKTLPLEKDFQGLIKSKNTVSAKSMVEDMKYFGMTIVLNQDSLSINLVCPPDDDYNKFEYFKQLILAKKELFVKFFKENKGIFLVLCKRNYKKPGDDTWDEEYKFDNNELCFGDYKKLLDDMDKLQPFPINSKKLSGLYIRVQFSKTDAVKIGKQLPVRACSEIVRFLNLCETLK